MIPRDQLKRLYEEHGRQVYDALAHYGVNGSALEDAHHDTWIIAAEKGPPDGEFGPWIHGIARRVASRYRRSAGRAAALFVHDDVEGAAPSADPERAAYAREVARAVDTLDPREREALVAAAEGYTAAEIAASVSPKVSEDGAESRIARARKAMRSRMNDDDNDKMVALPPFDGERLWRRIERTLSVLEEFRDESGGGPAENGPPSTPPVSVPLAPLAPQLAPGILPIAKAKLAGLLIGTFLLGAGAGAGAMHAWSAHRLRPGSEPIAEHPRAVEHDVEKAPGVIWTSSNVRYAHPGPTNTTASSSTPNHTTTERSFYPQLRRRIKAPNTHP